jgi:hypothetical protein
MPPPNRFESIFFDVMTPPPLSFNNADARRIERSLSEDRHRKSRQLHSTHWRQWVSLWREQAERLSSDLTTVRYRTHGTMRYIASQTSAKGSHSSIGVQFDLFRR